MRPELLEWMRRPTAGGPFPARARRRLAAAILASSVFLLPLSSARAGDSGKHWTKVNNSGDNRAYPTQRSSSGAAGTNGRGSPSTASGGHTLPPRPQETQAAFHAGVPAVEGMWLWYATNFRAFLDEVKTDRDHHLPDRAALLKYQREIQDGPIALEMTRFDKRTFEPWYNHLPTEVTDACPSAWGDLSHLSLIEETSTDVIHGGLVIAFSYDSLISSLQEAIPAMDRLDATTSCLAARFTNYHRKQAAADGGRGRAQAQGSGAGASPAPAASSEKTGACAEMTRCCAGLATRVGKRAAAAMCQGGLQAPGGGDRSQRCKVVVQLLQEMPHGRTWCP